MRQLPMTSRLGRFGPSYGGSQGTIYSILGLNGGYMGEGCDESQGERSVGRKRKEYGVA